MIYLQILKTSKMKSRIIISLFLILGFGETSMIAQTNGYMGKRLSVELNTGVSYYLTYTIDQKDISIHDEYYKEHKRFRWDLHPDLSIAYTVGRRTDLGIRIGYDPVKVKLPHYLDFSSEGNNFAYTAELEPYLTGENASYFQLKDRENKGMTYNLQFFIRRYTKKHVAPIGLFTQFSVGYTQFKYRDSEIEGYFSEGFLTEAQNKTYVNNQEGNPIVFKLESYKMFALSYFVGNKRIFDNGIYLNTGIEFNLFIRSKAMLKNGRLLKEFSPFDSYSDLDQNTYNYHYYLPKLLSDEIIRSQFFEVKIGLGKVF